MKYLLYLYIYFVNHIQSLKQLEKTFKIKKPLTTEISRYWSRDRYNNIFFDLTFFCTFVLRETCLDIIFLAATFLSKNIPGNFADVFFFAESFFTKDSLIIVLLLEGKITSCVKIGWLFSIIFWIVPRWTSSYKKLDTRFSKSISSTAIILENFLSKARVYTCASKVSKLYRNLGTSIKQKSNNSWSIAAKWLLVRRMGGNFVVFGVILIIN